MKNLKFLGADGQILTAGKSGKIPPGQVTGTGNISEASKYFYHPDQVGSTNYVTDATGEVYQHLEYFAFGETFVEEHSNTDRTPYLFNGKELDEETGLYYFGLRFFDPRQSTFLSVDPILKDHETPYAWNTNNPIVYSDPTGADSVERAKALQEAMRYVESNPDKGGKKGYGFAGMHAGKPGEKIDCSGLVSQCANESGFGYLNNTVKGKENNTGVQNIVQQPLTREVAKNDLVPGNIVVFPNESHVAFVTDIVKDKKGNVTGYTLIHSESSGGPNIDIINLNDKNNYYVKTYLGVGGDGVKYYAWDTPETNQNKKIAAPKQTSQNAVQVIRAFLYILKQSKH